MLRLATLADVDLIAQLMAEFYQESGFELEPVRGRAAIYGLVASPARFTCTKLRTRTPLDGFYMTGVDVASLGVVGAMTSGMLTAATLDPRLYRRLL